jgi:hypothetical protein
VEEHFLAVPPPLGLQESICEQFALPLPCFGGIRPRRERLREGREGSGVRFDPLLPQAAEAFLRRPERSFLFHRLPRLDFFRQPDVRLALRLDLRLEPAVPLELPISLFRPLARLGVGG